MTVNGEFEELLGMSGSHCGGLGAGSTGPERERERERRRKMNECFCETNVNKDLKRI